LAGVALAAVTWVAGEAAVATSAVVAAAAATLVAAAAATATSAAMAVAVAAVAVEATAAEVTVAGESGSGGGSSSSGMVVGLCCWCWRRMTKKIKGKHVFCIKFSPFISYWMENVYQSHEKQNEWHKNNRFIHQNVLPHTNWQNVTKSWQDK
jgi:hypothetical protein